MVHYALDGIDNTLMFKKTRCNGDSKPGPLKLQNFEL